MIEDSSPRISPDPAGELAALIARELELHEEGLMIARRIRELHQQISQRSRDAEGEMHPERRAQGDR